MDGKLNLEPTFESWVMSDASPCPHGADVTETYLNGGNLTDATYDSKTTWPTAEFWYDTTCPDGSNSDNKPSCGF